MKEDMKELQTPIEMLEDTRTLRINGKGDAIGDNANDMGMAEEVALSSNLAFQVMPVLDVDLKQGDST